MNPKIKPLLVGFLLLSLMGLTACQSATPPAKAPCDAFGQHCDPKIPINQWRTSPNNQNS